jgi:hypothetical protein
LAPAGSSCRRFSKLPVDVIAGVVPNTPENFRGGIAPRQAADDITPTATVEQMQEDIDVIANRLCIVH